MVKWRGGQFHCRHVRLLIIKAKWKKCLVARTKRLDMMVKQNSKRPMTRWKGCKKVIPRITARDSSPWQHAHHVCTRCPTARETACRSNPTLVVIGLSRGGQFCGLLKGWLDCIKLNDNLHGYTHEHMYHEDHVNIHTVTEWHPQLLCKMQPTKH